MNVCASPPLVSKSSTWRKSSGSYSSKRVGNAVILDRGRSAKCLPGMPKSCSAWPGIPSAVRPATPVRAATGLCASRLLDNAGIPPLLPPLVEAVSGPQTSASGTRASRRFESAKAQIASLNDRTIDVGLFCRNRSARDPLFPTSGFVSAPLLVALPQGQPLGRLGPACEIAEPLEHEPFILFPPCCVHGSMRRSSLLAPSRDSLPAGGRGKRVRSTLAWRWSMRE